MTKYNQDELKLMKLDPYPYLMETGHNEFIDNDESLQAFSYDEKIQLITQLLWQSFNNDLLDLIDERVQDKLSSSLDDDDFFELLCKGIFIIKQIIQISDIQFLYPHEFFENILKEVNTESVMIEKWPNTHRALAESLNIKPYTQFPRLVFMLIERNAIAIATNLAIYTPSYSIESLLQNFKNIVPGEVFSNLNKALKLDKLLTQLTGDNPHLAFPPGISDNHFLTLRVSGQFPLLVKTRLDGKESRIADKLDHGAVANNATFEILRKLDEEWRGTCSSRMPSPYQKISDFLRERSTFSGHYQRFGLIGATRLEICPPDGESRCQLL